MTSSTPAPPSKPEPVSHWPPPSASQPQVRYDTDAAYHELYNKALDATQMNERLMRRQRHYLIPQVLHQVFRLDGAAAEVGCFRGLSAFVACSVLQGLGRAGPFHIFDSFEGLSESAEVDQSSYMPPRYKDVPNLFACSEAQVRANLTNFSFVEYHKGWVPDCFAAVTGTTFSYVHIDVDLYAPTKAAVEFFWPRLTAGGAIVLDDYGTLFFPGARTAAVEFFSGRSDFFIVETPAGSAAAIKLRV